MGTVTKRKRQMETRYKDVNWALPGDDSGHLGLEPGEAQIAILMDIRDHLKQINQKLDYRGDVPRTSPAKPKRPRGNARLELYDALRNGTDSTPLELPDERD